MRRFLISCALLSVSAGVAGEQLDVFRSVVSDPDRSFSAIAALATPDGGVVTVTQQPADAKTCLDPACVLLVRRNVAGAELWSRLKAASLSTVTAAAVDSLGRIVVIGESLGNGKGGIEFGVARFQPDGSDDLSFGAAGRTMVGFNLGQDNKDKPTALAIDANDNIVIVGAVERSATNDLDFGIVRLRGSDGNLDVGFGTGGKSVIEFNLGPNSPFDVPYSVAINSSGSIVIGGIANDSAIATDQDVVLGHRPVLARLTSKGGLDTDFCAPSCNHNLYPSVNRGRRVYYFGSELPHADFFSAIDVAANGDIVAAGTTYINGGGSPMAAVARFNANGDQLAEQLESGTDNYARYMDVRFADSSGSRIIAAGQSTMHTTGTPIGYFIVQAFTATLDFDAGYGGCLSESSAICFSGNDDLDYFNDVARSLHLDAQGRPLFAGTFRNPANRNNGSALFQRITNNAPARSQ